MISQENQGGGRSGSRPTIPAMVLASDSVSDNSFLFDNPGCDLLVCRSLGFWRATGGGREMCFSYVREKIVTQVLVGPQSN